MTALFLGIYGIYFLMVAYAGNTSILVDSLTDDLRGYAPWIFAIIILAILTEFETTEPMVKPIIGLLILNFFLKNWAQVESQSKQIFGV